MTEKPDLREFLLQDLVAVEGVEDAAEAVVRRHHFEEAEARLGVARPRAADEHVLAPRHGRLEDLDEVRRGHNVVVGRVVEELGGNSISFLKVPSTT